MEDSYLGKEMEMKKYLIFALVIVLVPILTACDHMIAGGSDIEQDVPYVETTAEADEELEPEPELESEPELTTDESEPMEQEATPIDTSELEGSVQLSDLVGYWRLSHATDEAGVEVGVPYSDWLFYVIEIFENNSFRRFAYGTLSGDLIYAGNNSFTAINLVAQSEGITWYPEEDEITISYDPQSGFLRYTRVFNYPSGPTADTTHMYYVRIDSLPWSN